MMCDMILTDGTPWQACPRTFLKRISSVWQIMACVHKQLLSTSSILLVKTQGHYIPADNSLCYSSIGLDDQAEVIDAILEALETQGISIELSHTELGPAQQNYPIHHADLLRAADNVCLIRETVRSVARTFDLLATFAPKPFLDQAGSGAHMHVSLWGTDSSEHAHQNCSSMMQHNVVD